MRWRSQLFLLVTLALSFGTEVACRSSNTAAMHRIVSKIGELQTEVSHILEAQHTCEAAGTCKVEHAESASTAMLAEALEAARHAAMDAEDGILHAPAQGVGKNTALFVAQDAARYLIEAVGCLYICFWACFYTCCRLFHAAYTEASKVRVCVWCCVCGVCVCACVRVCCCVDLIASMLLQQCLHACVASIKASSFRLLWARRRTFRNWLEE